MQVVLGFASQPGDNHPATASDNAYMNDLRALRPDATQPTPLYLQLARNLEAAIHAGQWNCLLYTSDAADE